MQVAKTVNTILCIVVGLHGLLYTILLPDDTGKCKKLKIVLCTLTVLIFAGLLFGMNCFIDYMLEE